MVKLNIQGNIQKLDKTIKNEKIKNSTFLVTINTNQSYKTDDKHLENDIEVFDNLINNIILNNIDTYIKPDGFDYEKVKTADIDYTIERGNERGFIHCHILLNFSHTTKIQLDINLIKQKIINELGLKNVYINNKLIKNYQNQNILSYINKYV